jgi:hypothetical protein
VSGQCRQHVRVYPDFYQAQNHFSSKAAEIARFNALGIVLGQFTSAIIRRIFPPGHLAFGRVSAVQPLSLKPLLHSTSGLVCALFRQAHGGTMCLPAERTKRRNEA